MKYEQSVIEKLFESMNVSEEILRELICMAEERIAKRKAEEIEECRKKLTEIEPQILYYVEKIEYYNKELVERRAALAKLDQRIDNNYDTIVYNPGADHRRQTNDNSTAYDSYRENRFQVRKILIKIKRKGFRLEKLRDEHNAVQQKIDALAK